MENLHDEKKLEPLVAVETSVKQFPKFKCKKCGDIIWSTYSGHFAMCKCTAIAVDYTEYYGRHIGDPGDFILCP